MKKIAQGTFIVFILLTYSIVMAGQITDSSLKKIIELSGINKQVADYPASIIAVVEQTKKQGLFISDVEFNKIKKSINTSFNPSLILTAINKKVKNNMSDVEAKHLLIWYESDEGRIITEAEEKASEPGAYNEMIKDAKSLLSNDTMIKIANRIDELVKTTDFAMKLQHMAGMASFFAISEAKNSDTQLTIDSYNTQMADQERMIRQKLKQLIILSYAYCYKGIDPKIIEKYLQFLERQDTQKFHVVVLEAMENVFNDSFNTMMESLNPAIERNNKEVNNRIHTDPKHDAVLAQ